MGKEPTESLLQASERFFRKVRSAVSGSGYCDENAPALRWHVDFPSLERAPWLLANGWVVQGWAVLPEESGSVTQRIKIVAQWSGVFQLRHPLSLERPDVTSQVFDSSFEHRQHACGFRFTVPRHLREVMLSVWVDDQCVAEQTVKMPEPEATAVPSLKVLEGRDGWLFLDNDTNGSVDQYCGRLRLTESGIQEWQRYLIGVKAVAAQHRANMAMLVAPSKESVMGPRYHPDREGESDPIRQLLALPESEMFVYPVPELGQLGDAAFIQTDTHWTQQGAMTATCSLAAKLGLDAEAVAALFAKDVYRERTVTGDLGNKLEPPRQCKVPILTSFSYAKHRHYDNGLPNFGRLLVLVNEAALVQETCLIFGSSSSYSMFHYLCRVFGRVVFVHSAGSLDAELVDALKPAYLVIQTNARFVVQVPSLSQPLLTTIQEKQARLSEEEQALVAKRQLLVSQDDSLIAELDLGRWVSFE